VIIHCERGDRIIEAGNAAKSVLVVLSGYVEVRHRNGDLQVVLGPGDVMGEVAFLLNMPRTAHIIAASERVSVLCLDQPCLNRLLKYDTAMANKLLMNLCRCLCQRLVQSFDLLNG
jgi:CRP-like cAMP-binding protein